MWHRLLGKAKFPLGVAAAVAAVTVGTGIAIAGGPAMGESLGTQAAAAAPAVWARLSRVGVLPAGAATGRSRRVLLINGDRLLVGPAGEPRVQRVLPGTGGRMAGAMLALGLGGQTFDIPQDALPYLGRGLDPGLFCVGSLLRAEAGGRLPVTVTSLGRTPSLPGVMVTHDGPGTAHGYLTLAGARVFGAALARQFEADHVRGSYGQDGMFAGGVTVSLAGERARSARPSPEFPMHTLTVTGTTLAGQPDTGDEVLVFNADNASRFADPIESVNFFYRGQTRFSVPAGHYWAIGIFVPPSDHLQLRLDVLPQFTVSANTTVHMAARAASSKLQMVTPRPSVLDNESIEFRHPAPAGPTATADFLAGIPIFVSPTTRRPTAGTLQVFSSGQLLSPPTALHPYEYDVAYGDTSGLIPPQRHVVSPASLATVHARYYSGSTGTGAEFRFGLFPIQWNDFLSEATTAFAVPRAQTEYMTGNPAILWLDGYATVGDLFAAGQSDVLRTFRAGEHTAENWNAHPLHEGYNTDLTGVANLAPWVPSASRADDTLTLDVTPFSDSTPGHAGNGGFFGSSGVRPSRFDHITGHYQISENGKVIAAGNPLKADKQIGPHGEFDTHVTLTPHPATVSFALDASGEGETFPVPTASHTVWTWHSTHESGGRLPAGWTCVLTDQGLPAPDRACAAEPMMTLGYAVAGLSLSDYAKPGQQALHVSVGHLQLAAAARIAAAKVSVSFDGGKTWHPATVTGSGGSFTAAFSAPAEAKVSLRTSATDAAGGSVAETIINAYRTSR